MSILASLTGSLLAQVGGAPLPAPDVTVDGGRCSADVNRLRPRAEALLRNALQSDYRHFPVDRHDLIAKVLNALLTREAICAALTTPSGATSENHNDLRRVHQAGSVTEWEARRRGVISARVPLKSACPVSYDWYGSPLFIGAARCRDVTSKIDGERMPAMLYAVAEPAASAQAQLVTHAAAPFTNRYANGGPIPCGGGDAFHALRVGRFLPNLQYVARLFAGTGWSAWTLRRSCSDERRQPAKASDLMFLFGMRIFVPVTVSIQGRRAEHTLVLSTSAAGPASKLATLVPKELPYRRLLSTHCAAKIYLEAKQNGWSIRR
jgi:hypothetical protein